MRPSQFNTANLPVQIDSDAYIKAVIAEENRVCDPIDARINTLENEFFELAKQSKILDEKLSCANGFFARWGIRTKMIALRYKIDTNRDMRYSLTCARLRRTYA